MASKGKKKKRVGAFLITLDEKEGKKKANLQFLPIGEMLTMPFLNSMKVPL
jgi:hypothetical protein